MKRKNFARKILVGACSIVMGVACVGNVGRIYSATKEDVCISAYAADLGEIEISTYTGGDTWLAGTNRVLFEVLADISGKYSMTSGTISLRRAGKTYVLEGAKENFAIEMDVEYYENAAWINLSSFGKEYALNTVYAHQAGDVFLINGTFSNGRDSFEIRNTKIVINSLVTGDMYVEKEEGGSNYDTYTATFALDGATYETQSVVSGEKLIEPVTPTKEGDGEYTYTFDGWYHGAKKWDFEKDMVTEDVTLTAVFNAKRKEIIQVGYGYNGNVTTGSVGFYFYMQENALPYSEEWDVYYTPMTEDAVQRIRGGETTNVGDTARETIVKYSETEYYVQALPLGGWQDGDIFVLNGKFQNKSNGIIFSIKETYVKIMENGDGTHTDIVLNPTITFVNEDGAQFHQETIAYHALISEPASTPTKAEDKENTYAFVGWYHGETRWNFGTDIPNGDTTLTAKFKAVSKYATYRIEDVVLSAENAGQGFYFHADTNGAPYQADGGLGYVPASEDAVVKISANGTQTSVGNVHAETIVKCGEREYYVESWAIGGYEDGVTYVFNGTFKNAENMAAITFENVRIKLTVSDGDVTATVLRESFSMVDGAAVRLSTDENGQMGIRFESEIGYTYDEEATYHMMIAPVSYLKAFHITENYYTELVAALAAAGKDFPVATMKCQPFQYTAEELAKNGRNAGSYYIRGSLTNVRYENINVQFIGIAYKVKDGVYTYVDVDFGNARSLAEVASKALNDTANYPDGNRYLQQFVEDSFTQAGGNASATFSLNKTSIEGYPVAEQLSIVGIPAGADVAVAWASSDPSIVAVDNAGNVVGRSSGSATITAKFLGKTYACNVTNMASGKVELEKDGAIISWNRLANVATYHVSVADKYGESVYEEKGNATCVDLCRLGLQTGNAYVLSVSAVLDDKVSVATKLAFTYEDFGAVAYALPEDGETLSVGVWNGACHFTDASKIKEVADAGVNLIIGMNPVWHDSMESWIAVLDTAYEYGVSIIADPREYDGGFLSWDGTLPEYGKHPAITGFLAFDRPSEEDIPALTAIQTKFNIEKAILGRADLLFFVHLLDSSASAATAGEEHDEYERAYLEKFMNAVEAEVLPFETCGLLQKGGTEYIRKAYYQSFDLLSHAAKEAGVPLWYTLSTLKGNAGTGDIHYEPTEAELRWQMAVAMAFGAKNLTYATYTSNEADASMGVYSAWETTALYERIKKINAEYVSWAQIYNRYTWQGYAALDFGQTSNDIIGGYKANAMMENLSYTSAVNAIGGLSSVTMRDGSLSTDSVNNAKDLLVGMFADTDGNKAFMLTNAASAPNTYHSADKEDYDLEYSMADIGVTLTFDGGYAGVIVIKNGVKSYHALTDNQLTLTVGAWEGVFVIPVKAQTQLASVTGLTENAGVITWDAVDNANAYEVVVRYEGKEIINVTVTDTTFAMDRLLGNYTITVYAKNDGRYIKSDGITI